MQIRKASMEDLEAITKVEAQCFPAAEAAGKEAFKKRLSIFPDYFWLLEEDGKLIGFINGMVSDEQVIRDEMYEDASLHKEDGSWQTIFGVDTIPEYRRQGCAACLMEQVIQDAKAQGRKGCVLTCKDKLVHYYEKFGYQNLGISESIHGGAVWYDMKLEF